jgi:hypothetical protein
VTGSATVTSGAASVVDFAKSIDAGFGQQTSGGSTTGYAPTGTHAWHFLMFSALTWTTLPYVYSYICKDRGTQFYQMRMSSGFASEAQLQEWHRQIASDRFSYNLDHPVQCSLELAVAALEDAHFALGPRHGPRQHEDAYFALLPKHLHRHYHMILKQTVAPRGAI